MMNFIILLNISMMALVGFILLIKGMGIKFRGWDIFGPQYFNMRGSMSKPVTISIEWVSQIIGMGGLSSLKWF
jgi:hypothetical protein